jgi:predicted phosphodiesterase
MDIGDLSDRLLVFGGPYSNLAATQTLRKIADTEGIRASHVICTGDTVAYCAEPEQTVATIRDWGCRVVMGNCEEALASGSPDCGCGFDAGSSCAVLSDAWYRFADHALSSSGRAWMGRLPRQIDFRLAGKCFRVVHGAVDSINRFVFGSQPAAVKEHQIALAGVDVVIAGHCGIPFGQHLGNGYWLNAGVIGMPANDGTPDGWYLLLTPKDGGIRATWHRLAYPHAAASTAMRRAGLSAAYADCLENGCWPSLDVLPDPERQHSGQILNPAPLTLV